jgi:hypothetical protein
VASSVAGGTAVGGPIGGIAGGAGSLALVLVTGAFPWLRRNAGSLWERIQRSWQGKHREKEIWDMYKEARTKIIAEERDNSTRQYLIQDLRTEFRMQYPIYRHLWN